MFVSLVVCLGGVDRRTENPFSVLLRAEKGLSAKQLPRKDMLVLVTGFTFKFGGRRAAKAYPVA